MVITTAPLYTQSARAVANCPGRQRPIGREDVSAGDLLAGTRLASPFYVPS
jgi:hypothetical protein